MTGAPTPAAAAAGVVLREVAERVWAYVPPEGGWCLSNAGLIGGDASAVLVDTAATERRALALRAAVHATTLAPVTTVVNTHCHGDHTFGNSVFLPAVVVGHHDLRTGVVGNGLALTRLWPQVEWGNVTITPPSLTFGDRAVLDVDGTVVELLHLGPAHTAEDIVAWLPQQRVLFAGDLLWSQCTPFFLMGTLAGSLSAVRRMRALHPHVIVCGHGPVGGPEVLDEVEDYLQWVGALAQQAHAAGVKPLEAARNTDTGRFAGWGEPERLVANLHRAVAELTGEPVAFGAALADMAAYLGGSLRCHA